ncbi:two-component sensor histidine kinase [Actinophytocola xinjiangensis]|uniref:histidine kinase n=1 Tax=Actinophytocola xinjiangensis TaxID=485602 RepID=A0A7Z1AY89_9PSEU|nr:ATP-binding protein [Actinophytocola xinjiangensis]OLF11416.1 two-component sensor histidine kinase [Actinophytocola xinjiangensis]
MSSKQRAEPRRGMESWPLRRRLIAEQIILLAMVCVLIVTVTLLALHAFLVNQLDGRLAEARLRAERSVTAMRGLPPPREQRELLGAQSPGTVTAMFTPEGRIRIANTQTISGDLQPLSAAQTATLAAIPVDGQPRDRQLGTLGRYRLVSVAARDDSIVVTGLPQSELEDTMVSAGLILGGISLIGLLAAAGAGAVIVRRTLQPLQDVARTATRVAELPLDRGEVAIAERVRHADPNTEIGRVGLALNRMLGHVDNALTARHESETRVRQFVADASHELRTPLAAVRGYAELVRRGGEASPEIAHAIGRVEAQAARMTTLVEDLLLLARLDSGRPLENSTVDLSRLVLDAVSDTRVAGPEHHWRLALPANPVTVTGDTARLHQVLANLLSNARTHTPPGTTVTTGLSLSDGEVALTVTDDGPGIPEGLLPEVFERFARGDSSRSRAAGSTGLGLAIVSAVVSAHGGEVDVTSEPGRTEFTVWLPHR